MFNGNKWRLMRNTAKVMSKPLKIIFCKSLETGDLPIDWKTAKISPIYKNKGSKKMPNNYRPVCLTCVICVRGQDFW